ncbi:MAG: hypothetical protein V4557_16425 [Bacteroidota bacterium]
MRLPVFLAVCLITFTTLLSSCKKDPVENGNNRTEPLQSGDILIAGTISVSPATNGAGYWNHNTGVFTRLSPTAYYAYARGIAVIGKDVYVAGDSASVAGRYAMCWKNGKSMGLTSLESIGVGLFISGTDIYVAGMLTANNRRSAAYWKNGTLNMLPNSFDASSIYVSGTDVYVGGTLNTSGPSAPAYWKNGVAVPLPLDQGASAGFVSSITVSGADVYTAGYVLIKQNISNNMVPAYWKNNTLVLLGSVSSPPAEAKSIGVSGSDVYVAGGTASAGLANYWKNGIGSLINGSRTTAGVAFLMAGPDVYLAGYDYTNSSATAKLWKNGTEIRSVPQADFSGICQVP